MDDFVTVLKTDKNVVKRGIAGDCGYPPWRGVGRFQLPVLQVEDGEFIVAVDTYQSKSTELESLY